MTARARSRSVLAGLGLLALGILTVTAQAQGYVQTNLVSDIPGMAQFLDPNLVNPWGMASSPTSPIWVSDNHTGVSTLYNGDGVAQPLVVTIPPPGGQPGPAAPTGQVYNGNSGVFGGDRFIFATEDGTISGWNQNSGSNALLRADESAAGSVYKGLAIGSPGNDRLYATNFSQGRVDIFDSNYTLLNLPNTFVDPNLPAGYAPFNIENVGGNFYVTYALKETNGNDDVPGPGHGFVDLFDMNGSLMQRLISGDPLNSPWGLAVAPADFGEFANDLLVGNFGDGTINAFDPFSFNYLGTLKDQNGQPLIIPGLWGLKFGNGGNGGAQNSLYFTAGIPGDGQVEDHGLFGKIDPVPEPSSLALLALGLAGAAVAAKKRLR